MAKGMYVRLKNYNVCGRISDVLPDGVCVKDAIGQRYFCHESELAAITEGEVYATIGDAN